MNALTPEWSPGGGQAEIDQRQTGKEEATGKAGRLDARSRDRNIGSLVLRELIGCLVLYEPIRGLDIY